MHDGESSDTFIRELDAGRPARTWLGLNEAGIIGGAPELAIRRIEDAGLLVRTRLASDSLPPENDRSDRITLSIGRSGTVMAATAS